jgi:hypothetical protein
VADLRETILERLLTIAQQVLPSSKRMDFDLNDGDLPLFVLADGSEGPLGNRPDHHPGKAAHYLRMEPQFVLLVQESERMGSKLNQYRAELVRRCCTDETLAAFTGHQSGCRYEGCETGVQIAEGLVADMLLSFSIVYLFKPSEL